MSAICMNSRCNGNDWLCGRCRKLYPSLAAGIDARRREKKESNRGSTMYGRNYASNNTPRGASGGFNARTGQGHGTQYYDDNSRYSWNTDGQGDSGGHWTNQNAGKKSRNRHQKPPHAK